MEKLTASLPIIGIALILAFFAGKLAHRLKVPQVTAYILVGVLMGPSFWNMITPEMAKNFNSLNELAFGLILFNIGGEFHGGLFKKITKKHAQYSLLYGSFVFLFTSALLFVFSYFSDLSVNQSVAFSLFLGIVAIAAAPPTTLMVIKEYEARGTLTETIMIFLAVGTVMTLVGAEILTIVLQISGIWPGGESPVVWQLLGLIWSIVGSLIVGTVLGFLLSYWEQREHSESEILFAVICVILLGQSASHFLKLEPLLVSLFLGFALVNSSPVGGAIHARIKGLGLSIYALFFVLAGAHIDLFGQFKAIGILGFGYVFARSLALYFGAKRAAHYIKKPEEVSKFMGLATLSHAGAALAVVLTIAHIDAPSVRAITTTVLSSIFVFELIGPLVLRKVLIHAGEASLSRLKSFSVSKSAISLEELVFDFFHNLGILPAHIHPSEKTIKNLVDRKVFAIEAKANIKEVLEFVETHQQSIYPVVDETFKFEGVIDTSELRDIIFDPNQCAILPARDLIRSRVFLTENTSCEEAIGAFNVHGLDILPILGRNSTTLIGTLSFRTVLKEFESQGDSLNGKK
jgi:Kef-type K+ transport system membrane component KefB/CBS domain-containing protein